MKNPNKNDEVVLREPKEVLSVRRSFSEGEGEMKKINEESEDIMKNVYNIIK